MCPVAHASDLAEPERVFQALDRQVSAAEERIYGDLPGELSVRALRQSLQNILIQTEDIRLSASTEVSRINRLLASLGPPPEDGRSEDKIVQRERENLKADLAQHEGQIKRIDLITARAEQALADLTKTTQLQFQRYLLSKGPSPLAPASWHAALSELSEILYQSFTVAPSQWAASLSRDQERANTALRYGLITLVIAAAGWPLSRWMLRRFGRRHDIEEPSYGRRLVAAFVEAAGYGIIPLLFVLAVRVLFVDEDMLNYDLRVVVAAITHYLAIYFIGYGLIRAVFTPDRAAWRLTPLHSGASKRVVQRLKAVLAVFVVFGGFGESLTWAAPSSVLESVYALIYALVLYPALWALLRHRVWLTGAAEAGSKSEQLALLDDDAGESSRFWSRFRSVSTLALLSIPVSAIVGYSNLALFLTNAAMLTGLLVAGFLALRWLLHSAAEDLASRYQHSHGYSHPFLPAITGTDEQGRPQLSFWSYLVIDLLLLLLTATLLLPLWGLNTDDTLTRVANLFRDIKIGSYTFSLLDITLALTFFAVIMVITRMVQRALERHFLPKVIRDIGVRDALRTAVGYIGVIIAALVGISIVGLDLSNLALIAGALSVGLGFGLQNVVSNFVSGLILLAERPIKPGDWIVVNGNEGTVKKVNVRSTEIETFQRASVIIPNADLIASPVTNWTHKNVLGRLEVRVGVAYGSDVTHVRDLLMEIAESHPMVVRDPAPSVVFRDFGASSLDFELRCFLEDVGWVVIVGSEIRFSINTAFAEHGIEIPFPQQVMHLADTGQAARVIEKKPRRRTTKKSRPPPSEISESDGDGDSN